MASQWDERMQLQTKAAILPQRMHDREQALESLRTPEEGHSLEPFGVVPGKISVLEGASEHAVQELLQRSEKTSMQGRSESLLVAKLDGLPFQANTVSDVLRHIGIPETRLRQLLLQMGLQSVANLPPEALTPSQLRTLAVISALHGPEQTVILTRPFEGIHPQVARTLSDFLVVTALERRKAFVLLNPGPTVDSWKGSDWASWQTLPQNAPPQNVAPKPFGGIDLNIPQELLELQMARSARTATLEATQETGEATEEAGAGVQFLEETLEKKDPFAVRDKDERDRFRRLSQQTQQAGGTGFFSLPFRRKEKVALPSQLQYFNSERRLFAKSSLFLIGGIAVLVVTASFVYAWFN